MKINIKKLHQDAVIPTYAHATDAGLDLTAVSKSYDDDGNVVYGTGLAIEIPQGYVGLLFPRSSCSKKDLAMANCVGVIDSGYRGEVTAKFKPMVRYAEELDTYGIVVGLPSVYNNYDEGDRIAQLIIMPYPHIEFNQVEELTPTDRGEGGYGSTGL